MTSRFSGALVLALASAGASTLVGCKGCQRLSDAELDAGPLAPNGPAPSDAGSVVAVPLPREQVLQRLNPTHAPEYTGPRGSIEGVVRVDGPPSGTRELDFSQCPAGADVYRPTFRETSEGGERRLADAVVAVTGFDGFVPETREAVRLVARGCAYDRRTVTLTFGQRLEVENQLEKGLLTPALFPNPKGAVLGALPHGDPVKLYPAAPGRYLLGDYSGFKFLSVDVFVLPQPLHAVTDGLGRFRIDGVPVGKLEVHAMHPELGGDAKASVEVTAGGTAKVSLVVHHVVRPAEAGAPVDAGFPLPPLR